MSVLLAPGLSAPDAPARAPAPRASELAVLINTATGKFDVSAIDTRVDVLFANRRAFIDQYEGAPRLHWERSFRAEAVRKAWDEAAEQQRAWISARIVISYTPQEAREMECLDAYMGSRPINFVGNQDWNDAALKADIVRNRARNRAVVALLSGAR